MVDYHWLKKIPLFETFTDAEIQSLARAAELREFGAGEQIFDANAKASSLFLIKEGSVQIHMSLDDGDPLTAREIPTGSCFGEMSYIDRSTRTARASAKDAVKLLELPYAAMDQLFAQNTAAGMKFFRAIAILLSKRIRATNHDLMELRDLKLKHV